MPNPCRGSGTESTARPTQGGQRRREEAVFCVVLSDQKHNCAKIVTTDKFIHFEVELSVLPTPPGCVCCELSEPPCTPIDIVASAAPSEP